MCVCVSVDVEVRFCWSKRNCCLCTGGLVYRSHPSMGKAGKYGARSNGQGLELSRNMKELGRDGGQSIWACRLGLQLDYSTRRTQLAHDVTLERGEGAGRLVCLPVRSCCSSAALIRKTGNRIRWLADQLFCPSFLPPKQDQSLSCPRAKTRNMPDTQAVPTLT